MNVSLQNDFPLKSNRTARVIGCLILGTDTATGLPLRITATSKLVMMNSTVPSPVELALAAAARQQVNASWIDFGYPIHTHGCFTAGCITSVLQGVRQPAWLAVGRAVGWVEREGRDDTVFVASIRHGGGLWLLGPSDGSTTNLTDAEAGPVLTTVLPALRSMTGLAVDMKGALLIAGTRSASQPHYQADAAALARTPWAAGSNSYTNTSYLGPDGLFYCLSSVRAANRLTYLHMAGAWRHPSTGDVYAVDGGCGLLYRLEAAAFDPACSPVGACGQAHFVANLTAAANLTITNPDGTPLRQNVSLAGDTARGILYLAYGSECGVMGLNLTTGATLGWAVASNITITGETITLPLCGIAGDGGPAVGRNAALSSDVRQLAVDEDSGDLYIADTGNHRIRRVEHATGLLSTVAGIGQGGYTGDDGPAVDARLWEPSGVAVVTVPDPSVYGRVWRWLYIADTSNNAVRRVQLNDALMMTMVPSHVSECIDERLECL